MLTSTDLLLAISAALLIAALIWIRNERRLMNDEEIGGPSDPILDDWHPGGGSK